MTYNAHCDMSSDEEILDTETIQTAQKLLRVIYGFLRAVYALLRAVLRLLRVIYEPLTDKINPWTIVRRFLTCQKFASIFTDPCECRRVVPSYLRIPASYLRMLASDYELAIRNDS